MFFFVVHKFQYDFLHQPECSCVFVVHSFNICIMFPHKFFSTFSMLSPSTMVVSTLYNTAPAMQKKQNQFIQVFLQTYPIQTT